MKEWCEGVEKRDAVKKGLLVPSGEDQIERLRKDPNVQDPFKEWVQKGQKEVAEKRLVSIVWYNRSNDAPLQTFFPLLFKFDIRSSTTIKYLQQPRSPLQSFRRTPLLE